MDKTSNWTLTGTTYLQNFTDSDKTLSNIQINGFDMKYNSKSAADEDWGGESYSLPGGGACVQRKI
jgi:hypothetical protein